MIGNWTFRLALYWTAFLAALPAATLPAGFSETQIPGFQNPTAMAIAPDGRIFVCEQAGALKVIKNGAVLPTPFVTLPVDSSGERGLLGVAVPDSTYVYVFYTASGNPARNRLSRFTQAGDQAAAGTEVILMEFEPLNATIHNGGAIHFGPDGKLYVAIGENGVGANAQSFDNRLGKILRLNADGTIPSDNPYFTNTTGANRSIWALGLRNPFTFAFQPGSGRMLINDVGQNSFEEINEGAAGANYGWPSSEGPTTNPNHRGPLYSYGHGAGEVTGCAITGGVFYNPQTNLFPASYAGQYFFADYCSGFIRYLDPATVSFTGVTTLFASGIAQPVDLKVGADGAFYYLSRGAGSVFRVTYSLNLPPTITQHPANVTAAAGGVATFTVAASGSQPITYQWQRNGANITGATSATLIINPVLLGDSGSQYRVIVSNSFGTVASNPAALTVTNNQLPVAAITAPAPSTLYSGSDVIAFSGSGSDVEDGPLPVSNLCWKVDFYVGGQPRPFLNPVCGISSGSITVPSTGETSANVFYRFELTVRDSQNATRTAFVDVQPRIVTLRLESNPPGLQLSLDGAIVTAPHQFQAVAGIIRSIGAVSPQQGVGARYQFATWSDQGAIIHNIITPATSTTLLASFNAQYLLSTLVSPPNGGAISVTPPSADGYYASGANVSISVTTNPGFQFAGFSGSLSGVTTPQSILMQGPRTVTASFSGSTACEYRLNRLSGGYDADGDIGRFTVSTNSACAWNATANATWITLLSPATNFGNGMVAFRLDPNPLPGPRVGTISVQNQTFTIRQEMPGCSYALSAPSLNIPSLGGTFQVEVNTGPGCFWTAEAASTEWISLNNALARIGPGALEFTVPANGSNSARIGAIYIGGQAVQLLQSTASLPAPYPDVPSGYLFAPFISLLKESSIAFPCTPTAFCPETAVKRSEMAVFLVRAVLGTDNFQHGQIPYFSDVPVSHPQFPWIQKLRELGVTNGCTATTYCPDALVTRGQMAAFLVRARYGLNSAQTFPFPSTQYFTDVPPNDLFYSYVQKLRQISITVGCTATAFCPGDQNLRGQLASFLARAFVAP